MPASSYQADYISDLFEQCACDEHDVAEILETHTGIKGGEWPKIAKQISWENASDLIDALKDLKQDRERPSGRRERGR
jgi:hypothetical protein